MMPIISEIRPATATINALFDAVLAALVWVALAIFCWRATTEAACCSTRQSARRGTKGNLAVWSGVAATIAAATTGSIATAATGSVVGAVSCGTRVEARVATTSDETVVYASAAGEVARRGPTGVLATGTEPR